jgi:SAM-dependent methyltransferase
MPGAEADTLAPRRDTDADWRELGQTQPYWGVLSQPDFLTENITPERIEAFYKTGRDYIAEVADKLERTTGVRPAGRALDFGCGVGRLAEAMADHVGEVIGLDVSPGMLALARGRGGKASYVEEIPAGSFDWINSFIVFQHIPPQRGEAILQDLLARLAPGGLVSLQFPIWRDAHLEPPRLTGWRRLFRPQLQQHWERTQPVGQIFMYDYDLSRILRRLNEAGIEDMRLVSTNHGGHRGVIILARKTAERLQS